MNALTAIQRRVYDFLVAHKSNHGIPPTRAEIAGEFGWASSNAAQCVLKALEKKGWVTLLGHKRSRGVVINASREKTPRDWTPINSKPNTQEG
jgi:repressor LexA